MYFKLSNYYRQIYIKYVINYKIITKVKNIVELNEELTRGWAR